MNTNQEILKQIQGMSLTIGKIDGLEQQVKLINGSISKINGLVECQTGMRADIKEIKVVLAGDDFGNAGLVKDHKDLKANHHTLVRKQENMETKIWTTKRLAIGFGSLITLLLAILTYLAIFV